MFHQYVSRFLVLSKNITRTTTTNPSLIIIRRGLISSDNSGSTTFISNPSNQQQLTVDYLVNSCDLSPESALKASKRILLKSLTTQPDSVLSLFKAYGITPTQISQLISRCPSLLLADPDKTLKPKLEFFNSMGMSGPHLGKLLNKNTKFLRSSLTKRIIPVIDFLRSIVSTNDNIVCVFMRLNWGYYDLKQMRPNIATMRIQGVPDSKIAYFLIRYPRAFCIDSVRFKETVLKLKKMGGNPSTNKFVYGLHVLLGAKQPIWDARLDVFKSFGWSEDEVRSVFVRQPYVMGASAKKIKLALDFFTNSLKWTREDVAKNPTVILYNFEKRIIPRCHVLQILLSKGLINKPSMGHAIRVAEGVFLNKFVIRYRNELPELLKVYQSKKIGTEEKL